MSPLKALNIGPLEPLIAPYSALVAVIFTVEKFPEPLKNFGKSDVLGGRAGEGGDIMSSCHHVSR